MRSCSSSRRLLEPQARRRFDERCVLCGLCYAVVAAVLLWCRPHPDGLVIDYIACVKVSPGRNRWGREYAKHTTAVGASHTRECHLRCPCVKPCSLLTMSLGHDFRSFFCGGSRLFSSQPPGVSRSYLSSEAGSSHLVRLSSPPPHLCSSLSRP